MIIQKALESYKREILNSLNMLSCFSEDYVKQIQVLQEKYDVHTKRKSELDNILEDINRELLKYAESDT